MINLDALFTDPILFTPDGRLAPIEILDAALKKKWQRIPRKKKKKLKAMKCLILAKQAELPRFSVLAINPPPDIADMVPEGMENGGIVWHTEAPLPEPILKFYRDVGEKILEIARERPGVSDQEPETHVFCRWCSKEITDEPTHNCRPN